MDGRLARPARYEFPTGRCFLLADVLANCMQVMSEPFRVLLPHPVNFFHDRIAPHVPHSGAVLGARCVGWSTFFAPNPVTSGVGSLGNGASVSSGFFGVTDWEKSAYSQSATKVLALRPIMPSPRKSVAWNPSGILSFENCYHSGPGSISMESHPKSHNAWSVPRVPRRHDAARVDESWNG